MRSRGTLVAAIIIAIILLDQIIKIWVKTSFYLGEDLKIFSWFHLLFIENNCMAFGMTIGSKLALTIFRIVAVGALIWYICRVISIRRLPRGYLMCLAMITAGAAGNIIDCVLYGVIFSNPFPPEVATLFPAAGGYAPLFMGKVVDMFFFPLFSFTWPQWLPLIGGNHFLFFQPVFNFADAAISCGIIALIIFYHGCVQSPAALRSRFDS